MGGDPTRPSLKMYFPYGEKIRTGKVVDKSYCKFKGICSDARSANWPGERVLVILAAKVNLRSPDESAAHFR